MKYFDVNVNGEICADFGSAVGGFVDVLLKFGARKVYAVERGYGVLAYELRKDSRVVVMERINAMHVTLPEKVDLITIDASWTKQKNIVPNAIKNLNPGGEIISLIKPHYEIGKGKLDKDEGLEVVRRVIGELRNLGLILEGPVESPVVGEKGGNVEYLVYIRRQGYSFKD